jgi:carboxylesterase
MPDPNHSSWPPPGGWPPPGAQLIPGAEAWSAEGGPHGALVIHGFTANVGSMRGLAEALADAGFAVSAPLLPGHGTKVEDLVDRTWSDWYGAALEAYRDLAGEVDRVVVVGLSMGGSIAAMLAVDHPEIAGIVCINPAVGPSAEMLDSLTAMEASGEEYVPGIGSDIALPGAEESAYAETPVRALRSLIVGAGAHLDRLADIRCPLLLMTSTEDHVVPPTDSDHLAGAVSGPVDRIALERSYHVATMDYDKDLVETEAVAFAKRVSGEA